MLLFVFPLLVCAYAAHYILHASAYFHLVFRPSRTMFFLRQNNFDDDIVNLSMEVFINRLADKTRSKSTMKNSSIEKFSFLFKKFFKSIFIKFPLKIVIISSIVALHRLSVKKQKRAI